MWIIYSAAIFLLAVIAHAILIRIFPLTGRLVLFIISGSLLGLGLVALIVTEYRFFSVQLFSAISMYSFLCELYIFLFSSLLSSISMNILSMLYGHRKESIDITKIYSGEKMVSIRLERLTKLGMLKEEKQNHSITEKGIRFLHYMEKLQHYFKNKA